MVWAKTDNPEDPPTQAMMIFMEIYETMQNCMEGLDPCHLSKH